MERLLAQLPMDVREDILAWARLLEMPTFQVLRALLIAQLPPSQAAPQGSGMARPQTQFLQWQEINRERQLGAAPPPAAPAPETSIPAIGARA